LLPSSGSGFKKASSRPGQIDSPGIERDEARQVDLVEDVGLHRRHGGGGERRRLLEDLAEELLEQLVLQLALGVGVEDRRVGALQLRLVLGAEADDVSLDQPPGSPSEAR
jgi:hypothetical protein